MPSEMRPEDIRAMMDLLNASQGGDFWTPDGMPTNTERTWRSEADREREASAMAGMSHRYRYNPEDGVPVDYMTNFASGAFAANAPALAKRNQGRIWLTGPPDMQQVVKHRNNPRMWDPSGRRMPTEADLQRDQQRRMLRPGVLSGEERLQYLIGDR